MRRSRSRWSSKTTARPRWVRRCGEAADCLSTAPPGQRLPVRMTVPPSGWSGSESGRMTSVSWQGASATFSPRRLAVHREGVGVQHRQQLAQHRGHAARVVEVLHQVLARRPHVGEQRRRCATARRSGGAAAAPPVRPAMATRCTIALVEPPIAMSARIALSKAAAVRISEGLGPRASAISTARRPDISASASRRESARGDGRVAGQRHAERLGHRRHRGRGAHHHAVAGGAREAALDLRHHFVRDLARPPLGPDLARVGARAQLLVAPHAAAASARR